MARERLATKTDADILTVMAVTLSGFRQATSSPQIFYVRCYQLIAERNVSWLGPALISLIINIELTRDVVLDL